MQLPREVIVGTGIVGGIGEVCSKLGFSGNVLIVTGPKMLTLAQGDLRSSLEEASFSIDYLTVEDSTMENVLRAQERIDHDRPSVVVGFGGGKDIDVAKLSSANMKVPFISVPTTASHDGIASSHASIKGLDRPYSLRGQAPLAILADISVISSSPYRLIASGCGDIIAKYTAVRDWRLAHKVKGEYYGDYAAELALMSARLVMRNAGSIKSLSESSLRTVVEALISCGVAISIAGSTRPCSGSEHIFSHALTMTAPRPALHGEQCGVGAIMSAYLQGANWRLLKNVLSRIGAPTSSAELGIEARYIVEALTMVHRLRPERYTVFGERGISRSQAERLARRTGVIP
ncbi:NAD(P)-dependent glycerol-1-phosphate dehydrogenase [Candidatus Bathyarchaeota archaeon]|nr:NAD(P)-dependent glycerol-1-phosphate dehydrogenase [Candidatus Bathyarchaeota archaeon]